MAEGRTSIRSLLERPAEVVCLGQPLVTGMPRLPRHTPFRYALHRPHGDDARPSGATIAADRVALETHAGTHVDSVFHVGDRCMLHGGVDARAVQSASEGIRVPGVGNLAPIVGRGLLLDLAALTGAERVPEDYAITPDAIDACLARAGTAIEPGDVVLLRTGWDSAWGDPESYLTPRLPGPTLETARLLVKREAQATGSDTAAYERHPSPDLAVHVELLVRAGIPIMENLDLRELARRGAVEFQFVAAPLNIPGATGSPINPLAFVTA